MSLLQNQSVEIVVDAHAAPYMLHDGNHEVTVELDSQSSRVMVNVTNCRTGDKMRAPAGDRFIYPPGLLGSPGTCRWRR